MLIASGITLNLSYSAEIPLRKNLFKEHCEMNADQTYQVWKTRSFN